MYEVNDLVAIKRTQQGPGLKLKTKFFGPYKITDRTGTQYQVEKVAGVGAEGPNKYLEPWTEDLPGPGLKLGRSSDRRISGQSMRSRLKFRTGGKGVKRGKDCLAAIWLQALEKP